MKGSRFNVEQIIAILREQEAGAKTADVCRKHGISSAMFYKSKSKYGGLKAYREERLQVRRRGGRKSVLGTRVPLALPQGPSQRWSLDVRSDTLTDSRQFRILAVVDDFTRECLAARDDLFLPSEAQMRRIEPFFPLSHGIPRVDDWRVGRPPAPDEDLISAIKGVIAELPTYGYRRVRAILKRQALAQVLHVLEDGKPRHQTRR